MSVLWRRHREDMAPKAPRLSEHAQPVCPVVLCVEIEPEPGAWEARYRHCGETRRGKADSVELAKQAALDAAEDMLRVALDELARLRAGVPAAEAAE